jgi:arylsulfatase A-like enzyme
LDLVGIQHQFSFEGRSIVPILQNKNFEDRYIISDRDAGDQKAIQKGEWKLLVLRQKTSYIPYELYNIKEDPNEQNNLIYSKSEIARKMLRESNVHISTPTKAL